MSKIGSSIIRGLEQALAYAQGTADVSQFVVHTPESIIASTRAKRRGRSKPVPPIHPGEVLREEFLIPLGMTARMLAKEIKAPERRLLAIVKEQ